MHKIVNGGIAKVIFDIWHDCFKFHHFFQAIIFSCHQKAPPPKQEIVKTPEQMKETVPDVIRAIVGQMSDNGNRMDSVAVLQPDVVRYLYDKNNDEARWSREAKWTPVGSLLIKFIENARLYG